MRLGALLSEKKDDIIAMLTKIPMIEVEFKMESDQGVMTSSTEFMKLVDKASMASSEPKEIYKAVMSEKREGANSDKLVGGTDLSKANLSVTLKSVCGKRSSREDGSASLKPVVSVASDESVDMPACVLSPTLDIVSALAEYVPRGIDQFLLI